MARGASAPGKLMIAGEYAVLEGAPALVVAVGRRVRVRWSAAGSDRSSAPAGGSAGWGGLPPEAVLARERAELSLGPVLMTLELDASALRAGDEKLGLGSSAAGAAAAAAAVHLHHGADLARSEVRRAVLADALAGHRAVAPEGSGADVVAAVFGGLCRVSAAEPAVVAWPPGLAARSVWTGQPARTSSFVAAVRRLAETNPERYEEAMRPLRESAAILVDAFERGAAGEVPAAAARQGAAMKGLGEAAGVSIVTQALERLDRVARACGGGAKPSGAGGGDVGMAFFDSEEAARRFEAVCAHEGLEVLPLELGVEGVRSEEW